MKKLIWIGDLYLSVYNYFDENSTDFTEKDIYLFILCLIRHRKIEHYTQIDHQFVWFHIMDVFKNNDFRIESCDLEPYSNISNLKQQLEEFQKFLGYEEYIMETKDYILFDKKVASLSLLPSWSFLDEFAVNKTIQKLEKNALYLWFGIAKEDEKEIFNYTYKEYLKIKK